MNRERWRRCCRGGEMAKLPWMQFYPADYLLDTQLLSPAARGIWMDLICHLWRAEPRGTMTLPVTQWARLLRCSVREVTQCIDELKQHDICNAVTLGNSDVTLSSRRLLREEKRRRGAAMRVSRHREKRVCNALVTGENQKSEVIYQNQKSESEEEKKKKLSLADESAVRFEEFWKIYPDRSGKKLEKGATKLLFVKLSAEDQLLAIQAAKHYADALTQQGISAKDPKRFLRDGKGLEPWRDWIEPAASHAAPAPPQQKCAWVNGGGCEDYAIAGSKYCQPHKDRLVRIQAARMKSDEEIRAPVIERATVHALDLGKIGKSM